MRTTIRNIALLLTAVVMAITLGGDGLADEQQREVYKRPHSGQFTAAGKHTGMLHGTIELGGRPIQITKDTKVYLSGKGLVKTPMLYGDAIYVMGSRTADGSVATMILVRPLNRDASGGSDRTGVLSPDEPL